MAIPRLTYLCVLFSCGIFYLVCGEWFSWLLLLAVLCFPWLCLALSLPAMLRFQAAPAGPEELLMGSRAQLWLAGSCDLPMPAFRGILRLHNSFTGANLRYNADKGVPTLHCGSYTVTVEKAKVYDYLGLFWLPVLHRQSKILRVLPKPIPLYTLPDLQQHLSLPQQPKPVSYFENHELRPYRPGDPLNQIHWKLSAKTGRLILREGVQTQSRAALLTMTLSGTPEELDRKLGRFFWLGNHILQQQIPVQLHLYTGKGTKIFLIQDAEQLRRTLDEVVTCPPAKGCGTPELCFPVQGHYHIGGAPGNED